VQDRGAPALDRPQLVRLEIFVDTLLEAERGEEVAAEQVVLELGGFGENVEQVFAGTDHGEGSGARGVPDFGEGGDASIARTRRSTGSSTLHVERFVCEGG